MLRNTRPCVVLYLCVVLCRELYAEDLVAELRPQCPPREGNRCQDGEPNSSGESTYKIDGRSVYINYVVGSHFEMQCDNETRSAEHPALPRFAELVRVRKVKLISCEPPALPYAQVLAALNVSVADTLRLRDLPALPPLQEHHFEGLLSLTRLELQGVRPVSSASPVARLPSGVLAPLSALRYLTLNHVQPGVALKTLPLTLNHLWLWFTGERFLTLEHAPSLHLLSVREENAVIVNVTGIPALESLTLSSPNSSLVNVTRLGSLRELGIDYWYETRPEPLTECDALKQLLLMDSVQSRQMELPNGWVARCPVLYELSMRRVALAPLPPHLLTNATSLKTLTLTGCRLVSLPKDLFNDTMQLNSLDLSHNRLETLSRDLFFSLRALKTLNLSNNLLTASVAQALQPLSSLTHLLLADNMRLSDLCDGGTDAVRTMAGLSPLQQMVNLTKLVLRKTKVTRVCRDWREGMPQLKELDLTETSITVLKYEDVMQRRSTSRAKMTVGGKNYTIRFDYSSEDYERARTELVTPGDVFTIVNAFVVCDCSAYWAALVFRKGLRHTGLHSPTCTAGDRSLRNAPPDTLTCAAPELCAGLHGCSCVSRDDVRWSGGVATARCEHLGLTTVPAPLPLGPVWRLMLRNNNISSVHTEDLPPQLLELDLRNNTLETIEQNAAAALLTRSVKLANNPFRCDCDALGLLREMAARVEHVDLENITCAGGSVLPSPERLAIECAPDGAPLAATVFAALLAVLAVAAFVLATVLARPETRLRLKLLLERAGWLPRRMQGGAGEAGDGWLYDAFVSHAHEDEEWVRATLVQRLESGPAPFRLCVHYRDWAPGEWIPAQIAASVRASRRTLAVVSKHFLKSDWARLEFREAHAQACRDVTPRLVVLLLEDPALLPMDAEMRAFIENNTYVRWGDPWFWKKLEHAMPPRSFATNKTRETKHPRVPTSPPAPNEPHRTATVLSASLARPEALRSYCSAAPYALSTPHPPPHPPPHIPTG